MKIDFNIGTVVVGLSDAGMKDQMHIMGRFRSKKDVVEALDCSMYYFNGYASFCLSPPGEELVRIEGENKLIVTRLNEHCFDWGDDMKPIFRTFTYWVQIAPDEWQKKTYDPKIQGINIRE